MTINDLSKPPLRSQPTRDRILEAAKLIFGRDGYDHATIRAIAAAADINPAMVMRYYGNKDALFAAVTSFKPDMSSFATVPRSRLGEAIVKRVLDIWDNPELSPARRAMLRSALSSEPTAAIKYWTQIMDAYLKMLAPDGPSRNNEIAIALIGTQVIGLLVSRYIIAAAAVTALTREQLIHDVGRTLQTYIRNMDRASTEE